MHIHETKTKRNVLVPGGAGFVGSYLVPLLIEGGYNVVILDNLATRKDLIDEKSSKLIVGDIRDEEVLIEVLNREKIDVVINLAALPLVDESISDPWPSFEVNAGGLLRLLNACRLIKGRGEEPPLVVDVNTDEAFGPTPVGQVVTCRTALRPANPYAASKASARLYSLAMANTYSIPVVGVHLPNLWGPRLGPEQRLISRSISMLLRGHRAEQHGDGRQTRSWLTGHDAARGILCVMEKGRIGSYYSFPTLEEVSIRGVLHLICAAMGFDPSQYIERRAARPGNDSAYRADGRELVELGWKPEFSLMEKGWWWEPLFFMMQRTTSLPLVYRWCRTFLVFLKTGRPSAYLYKTIEWYRTNDRRS